MVLDASAIIAMRGGMTYFDFSPVMAAHMHKV
jgi:hypothetical protein